VCPHDDQVDGFLLGVANNVLAGAPGADFGGRLDVSLCRSRFQVLGRFLAFGFERGEDRLGERGHPAGFAVGLDGPLVVGLDDVEQVDARPMFLGEVEPVVGRLGRRIAAVRRDEDAIVHSRNSNTEVA
jgi:hypothetical protein